MKDRLEIKKELFPYRVSIPLGMSVFDLEFHYNAKRDYIVVHLYWGNTLVCAGERLVYGRPLFGDCYEVERYPVVKLVPFDESGMTNVVQYDTLGVTVFLTVDDTGLLSSASVTEIQ
ncbi:hypothetical protein LJC49_04465 [Ruminococcaceae bacterium OttesenSCG-928-I18]|nr:hypothetical protein [Ruminococcaceae bacterium OttesenSCG-928-I18]